MGRGLVPVQVPELCQQRADAVEGSRDHMGAPGDPAVKRIGLALQPQLFLRLPGVLLAIRAAMAGMAAQPAAQLGDVVVLAARPSGPASPRWLAQIAVGQLVAHRRGEVLAVLGRADAERVRYPDPVDRRHRHREISDG